MAFTQRGREHEKEMERLKKQTAHQKALDEKAEADAQRASNERIAREEVKKAQLESANERYAINKEAKTKRLLTQAEERCRREVERTKQIQEAEATKRRQIAAMHDLELGQIKEKEATKRHEISAANQLDLANIQKEVEINKSLEETKRVKLVEETKIHEINFREKACQEISKMFIAYMDHASENYRFELQKLYDDNIHRREINLQKIQDARVEKEKVMQLSRELSGQEKLDMLTRCDELENTINFINEADMHAEEDLKAKLASIAYKQKLDMEQNRAAFNENQNKLFGINQLFLEDKK